MRLECFSWVVEAGQLSCNKVDPGISVIFCGCSKIERIDRQGCPREMYCIAAVLLLCVVLLQLYNCTTL